MSGSIWLIVENDPDNDYSDYGPDLDLGYFASEADAQAFVDEKNAGLPARYAEYVEKLEKDNAERERARQERLRKNQVLRDAGFEVKDTPHDTQRFDYPTRPFDRWRREESTFEIVEVLPATK